MSTPESRSKFAIPLFAIHLSDLRAYAEDGNDFGSVPSLPGGYELVKNKTIPVPDYTYSKPDGQPRLTLSDIKVTVNRYQVTVDGNQLFWTGAQAAFTQYNHTQNNRGSHDCRLSMVFLNASGGPQGIIYQNVPIIRDQCYLVGRANLPEVYSGKDVFDIVQAVEIDMTMTWEQEGACD
ncbi:hypothetical protein AB4Y32_37665 [Paraburkholderia phymatum]|uniref:Uncharacterized protein n=1 Tax=Paraburkholderia phymatum TaxID=148447 RepID=A0ACC6UCX5_9BURK